MSVGWGREQASWTSRLHIDSSKAKIEPGSLGATRHQLELISACLTAQEGTGKQQLDAKGSKHSRTLQAATSTNQSIRAYAEAKEFKTILFWKSSLKNIGYSRMKGQWANSPLMGTEEACHHHKEASNRSETDHSAHNICAEHDETLAQW